jgi:hypothetical protein
MKKQYIKSAMVDFNYIQNKIWSKYKVYYEFLASIQVVGLLGMLICFVGYFFNFNLFFKASLFFIFIFLLSIITSRISTKIFFSQMMKRYESYMNKKREVIE